MEGWPYSWKGMAVCYSRFHLAHRSCEMETLADCFSDLLLIYIPVKHDCHVLRAISSGFFFIWHLLYKDRLSWILDCNPAMKYPSTLTYSSCKFWTFILYQVGQCNTLYTPCDLLSVWRKKVQFIDLPPTPNLGLVLFSQRWPLVCKFLEGEG